MTLTQTPRPLEPTDFTTELFNPDYPLAFPFVEDENGNLTGFGHQDRAAFAAAANAFEQACGVPPRAWTAAQIGHSWVRLDEHDDERLIVCTAVTFGAVPVTTLWGQR